MSFSQVGNRRVEFVLCYLWGWSDDPHGGMHSSAVSGQQPHHSFEGWRLSEPQARSSPSLQPLWLPSYVGRTWLGTSKGSHLEGSIQESSLCFLISPHGTALFLTLQCSRSCGGGFQTRQVLCKQRLADGSILELPDTFCPSKSPASQQPCAKQECPPQWIMTNWSEVSHPSIFWSGEIQI